MCYIFYSIMSKMKNIGIFYNPVTLVRENSHYLKSCVSFLQDRNINVFLLSSQKHKDLKNVHYLDKFEKGTLDLLIVFGGDGTMLLAGKMIIGKEIPLLGFNFGKLGFLSGCEKDDFQNIMEAIINRNFDIEKSIVVECNMVDMGKRFFAINDCIIYRGEYPKLIDIDVYRDDKFIYMISADGVIVATPVGSTSYSLSAGGSILSPDTDVLSITPISPQNLFIHPIIVPADSKLSFILKNDAKGAHINIDGEDIGRVVQNEKIVIELSKHSIKFVRLAEQNFYSTLRQKLFLQNTNIRMK